VTPSRISLPQSQRTPLQRLALRVVAAGGLLLGTALVAWIGGDGYRDGDGTGLSFMDAVYYATVSVTTTGYGDITPVTDGARLATTFLVTPARILFLIILVGTTVEVLAEGSRAALREHRWRAKLRDHVIVCGYGTKGRSAIEVLLGHGRDKDQIVVIDPSPDRVQEANEAGLVAIHGDATRSNFLLQAGLAQAEAIIIAPDRDDAAVLMTLTAREHGPGLQIVAAVREEENRHLLQQSGADSVITSSGAAGRLLGFAARSPGMVEVLEDLLSVGTGLDLTERPVPPEAVGGPLSGVPADAPILAVVREGKVLRFDAPDIGALRAEDRLVCLCVQD
jgi:voltage-gated potassium channel